MVMGPLKRWSSQTRDATKNPTLYSVFLFTPPEQLGVRTSFQVKRGARVAKAPRGKSLLGAHADTRMGSFTLIGTRVLRTVLITSIVVVVMVVENRARNDARVRDAFRDVTNKFRVCQRWF